MKNVVKQHPTLNRAYLNSIDANLDLNFDEPTSQTIVTDELQTTVSIKEEVEFD